jgi:hypothetical protein
MRPIRLALCESVGVPAREDDAPTVDRLAITSFYICNGLPDAALLRWTLHTYNAIVDGDVAVRATM